MLGTVSFYAFPGRLGHPHKSEDAASFTDIQSVACSREQSCKLTNECRRRFVWACTDAVDCAGCYDVGHHVSGDRSIENATMNIARDGLDVVDVRILPVRSLAI